MQDNDHYERPNSITEPGPYDKAIDGAPEPTGAALRPEDDHLLIKLRLALPEGCSTLYLDSLGLGTQTVPYGFMSGTSMAAPRVCQSLVNDGGQLRLVGGSMADPAHPDRPWMTVPVTVTDYDLAAGAGNEFCSMPVAFTNPQLAAKDGTILAYSDGVEYSANPTPEIVRILDGEATKLEGGLPFFLSAEEAQDRMVVMTDAVNYPYHAVVAPVSDGFVLVGPPAADGSSDTFVLRDGADVFEAYEKRSSDDCVYVQAACSYRGRLFVIGSAIFEPDDRLFRATAMDVPEYPGDIPCEEDPEPVEPDVPVGPDDPAKPDEPVRPTPITPDEKTAAKSPTQQLPKTADVPMDCYAVVVGALGAALLFVGRRFAREE